MKNWFEKKTRNKICRRKVFQVCSFCWKIKTKRKTTHTCEHFSIDLTELNVECRVEQSDGTNESVCRVSPHHTNKTSTQTQSDWTHIFHFHKHSASQQQQTPTRRQRQRRILPCFMFSDRARDTTLTQPKSADSYKMMLWRADAVCAGSKASRVFSTHNNNNKKCSEKLTRIRFWIIKENKSLVCTIKLS
jgi:hypothetical protein